jgi:2-hydroxychromene-2-carboxylate isomerase
MAAGGREASFYFDLGSAEAYLVAERLPQVLGASCEWQPILASRLPQAHSVTEQDSFRDEVEQRAREYGLQPLVWPEPFPFDSAFAMHVATFAKRTGRTVAFAQAAFRQAFAAGRALSERDNVVIAAAACELHPAAVLRAADSRGVRDVLERATVEAVELGVVDIPAVRIGEQLLIGADVIEALEGVRR